MNQIRLTAFVFLSSAVFLFGLLPSVVSAATIISDVTINGNTIWTKANNPYLVSGLIDIPFSATLTIEPGTIVKMTNALFYIRGRLYAKGTESEPVFFTSSADDSIGGDDNNDGAATVPSSGSWSVYADSARELSLEHFIGNYSLDLYLYRTQASFLNSRLATTSYGIYFNNSPGVISHTVIEEGESGNGILTIDQASVRISESRIVRGPGTGIAIVQGTLQLATSTISQFAGVGIQSASGNIVSSGSVITGNGTGLLFTDYLPQMLVRSKIQDVQSILTSILGAKIAHADDPVTIATLHNNMFSENTYGALMNDTQWGIVDARWNFWGDSSGPNHATVNPSGAGGVVTGNVLLLPWLSEDPTIVSPPAPSCCSSVAFIPGVKASRLYKMESCGLFISCENQLWNPNRNADAEKLFMTADGSSADQTIYTRDVIESAFGTVDIYKNFISSMNGLVSDGKISAFKALPYDWRLDLDDVVNNGVETGAGNISYINPVPNSTLPYMISEIKKLAANSKTGKVTIVAHSNGGLVAKKLMQKLLEMKASGASDLADKIDTVILVAVPELGTPVAAPAILHGFDQGMPFLLSAGVARDLAKNMQSAYNLLPSEKYFATVLEPIITFDDSALLAEPKLATYGKEISTYDKFKEFLLGTEGRTKLPIYEPVYSTNFPISISSSLLDQSESNHSNLDNWQFPPNVEVVQIAGWGVPTLKGVKYTSKEIMDCQTTGGRACLPVKILDMKPVMTRDGDSTVVTPSAVGVIGSKSFYLNIKESNENSRKNISHKDILEIGQVQEEIKNTLQGISSLPSYITTEKPTPSIGEKNLVVSVHSPVSIDAYDSLGNHTGLAPNPDPNSDLLFVEENIPNSYYMNFGEGKYIGLPDGDYTINLAGTGFGTFTFQKEEVTNDQSSTTVSFVDIPVTPLTTAELDVSSTNNTAELKIDTNGDGTDDFFVQPNQEFDPILYLQMMKQTIIAFNLSKNLEKQLIQKIDNVIKSIEKNKIKNASRKVKQMIYDAGRKRWKHKKISQEDKVILVNMLNQLLNNLK